MINIKFEDEYIIKRILILIASRMLSMIDLITKNFEVDLLKTINRIYFFDVSFDFFDVDQKSIFMCQMTLISFVIFSINNF